MGFSLIRKGLIVSGLLAAAGSVPALADVKAGVDAWTRGEFPAAIREWQPLADKGDPDAQFNLAQAYKLGRGVPQDLTRAEMLYAKAATQGHLQAGDNYGLLLFQRGQHAAALPYIRAASDRGDPRSQYLLGLAYFNADVVGKDWVRAYALESLAAQPTSGAPGLPQAKAALTEMDKYVAIEDRQRAISLATELAAQVEANRQRQLAAVDLGTPGTPIAGPAPAGMGASRPVAARPMPTGMAGNMSAAAATPIMREPAPRAVAAAPVGLPPAPTARVAMATQAPTPRPAPMVVPTPAPAPRPVATTPPPAPKPVAAPKPTPVGGPYKLQLGAFGVAGNADALWAKVKSMPEIAGHARVNVPSGKVTRLMASGYNEDSAQAACRKLVGAGLTCIVVRD